MKQTITLFVFLSMFLNTMAQIDFDLSKHENTTETIDLNIATGIRFKNLLPKAIDQGQYTFTINMSIENIPTFNKVMFSGAQCESDSDSLQEAIKKVVGSADEELLSYNLKALEIEKKKSANKDCIVYCNTLVEKTVFFKSFLFKLQNNQTIIVTVKRQVTKDSTITWTKIYKTPEKTRWLVHYGLTYASSIISKTDKYFAFADTSTANRYTITKNNDNGPRGWDNISATIEFTYPFHGDERPFDGGFTAGFGINSGFELSGHAGLSAIIGENIILGSGIVFMQKYKLRGEYKENQVIKTNLNFEALHEKVWLPELYFTIGFRFGSNPFAKKSTTPASTNTTSTEQ